MARANTKIATGLTTVQRATLSPEFVAGMDEASAEIGRRIAARAAQQELRSYRRAFALNQICWLTLFALLVLSVYGALAVAVVWLAVRYVPRAVRYLRRRRRTDKRVRSVA